MKMKGPLLATLFSIYNRKVLNNLESLYFKLHKCGDVPAHVMEEAFERGVLFQKKLETKKAPERDLKSEYEGEIIQ